MKWELVIDGKARSLELDECGAGRGAWELQLDRRRARADAREVEPGVYSLLIDGRSYEVKIESAGEGYCAAVNGRRYEIHARDPQRRQRGSAAGRSGRQKVASPMPGKVARVLVKEGDEIAAGQGVAVVEAMKMQNEVRSPKAGRVVSLRAAVGAPVAAGETLAEVE